MSDYDLKNIPTLDDVIDESAPDDADADNSERDIAEQDSTSDDIRRETSRDRSYDEEEADELIDELSPDDTSDFETENPVTTESEIPTTDFDSSEPDISEPETNEPGLTESGPAEPMPVEHVPADAEPFNTANVSVQISYDEIYDKTKNFLNDQSLDDTGPTSDEAIDNIQPSETIHSQIDPIALNTVVEDVVKQLLPDLEQQLRFLIEQALEKRLPKELIQSPDSDSDTGTEIDSE